MKYDSYNNTEIKPTHTEAFRYLEEVANGLPETELVRDKFKLIVLKEVLDNEH